MKIMQGIIEDILMPCCRGAIVIVTQYQLACNYMHHGPNIKKKNR
jgi:hypothetical protein